MTAKITLAIPDSVYSRAEHLAQLLSRNVADVLTEAITLSPFPVGLPSDRPSDVSCPPVASLSDAEVLAMSELQMEPEQNQRLSELLDQQQAGLLTEGDRRELWILIQVYQEKLLLKAQALAEAVQRGLREPLTP